MKVGELDLVTAIIQAEQRLHVLEKSLDYITSNNRSLDLPSRGKVEEFREEALSVLQNKYPSLGIKKN